MKVIQRIIRGAILMTALTVAMTGCGLLQSSQQTRPDKEATVTGQHYVMLVGTFGHTPQEGEIQSFTINPSTLAMEHTGTVQASSPSFMALGADRETVFVTNETPSESTISSYRLYPSSGELTLLSQAYTIGEGPTYVATSGKYVVTANYQGGSISLTEVDGDGMLAPVDWHIRIGEKGKSHPHSVFFTSDGSQLFATDLGLDRVLHFGIREDTPPITLDASQVTLPEGSGPRHIILSKDDRFAYVVCELIPQIYVYRNDQGTLTEIQRISTHRTGTGGGHIALSHDGRFLYTTHRDNGADAIIAFAVDRTTGRLTYVSTTRTGRHPRHFAISSDDRYLAVALRDDDMIRFYKRNKQTGELKLMEESTIRTPKPMYLLWETFDD
jgi:6-phosphogluconolactonase